jgi:signal transduction histidine kinase
VTTAPPLRRARAPIGLQLVALLFASLLAAQAISFVMITVMPPPRPQLYRVSEIAAALRGAAVRPRLGRPLIRSLGPAPPPELSRRNNPRLAHALAAELGAPEADVRVMTRDHPPPWRRVLYHEPPGWGHRRFEGRPPGAPPGPGSPPPTARPLGDMPMFGDVEAALRQPQGDWMLVRSQPEPFPTEWEWRGLIWLAVGFLLVAPAGILFARRITAPLQRFAAAADRLGRDPKAPPLALSGPAEIGLAASAFNEMQARLRRYIDDRTAMVGAISHDLRTPLARIRFKMERAPPELRERLDLLSLVECVVDDAASLGADVEIDGAEPALVEGDPVGLQRMFANLIDNAVKYGAGARIEVRRGTDQAVVEITDFGPGLAAPELERVFLPFYRTDASRNLDKGGVGLGLPIARATARAHGGDVELTSSGQGAVARVSLPLAAG